MRSIEFEHFWTPVLDISVDKNVAKILQDSAYLSAPPVVSLTVICSGRIDRSDHELRIQPWNIRHRI